MSTRQPSARLALALGLVALVALAARTAGEGGADAELADPLPLRRVLLTADRLPREMARLKQGVLRQLPREAFEEKVRLAARAQAAANHPPRLTEARYRAGLADTALVGTAQWKVVHPGTGAGLLPLQPLNLALRQPRFENRDALIADFDGKAPALFVEGPGDHAVAIEWSARSEERPEGLHFDLKLPPCPVAVLELDLPADRVAATADGALVSGPHPAEAPDRRLWRVGCGGRPGVDLWVRRAGAAAAPTLLLYRLQTTQTLEPEGLEASFLFDLEVLHREVSELTVECDPDLRPCEVTAPDLAGWEVRPPANAGAATVLVVRLREPLQPGRATVQVRCLAPLTPAGARPPSALDWHSPGVRLLGAVPRGETLVLRFHPDLRVADFQPGSFRIVPTATEMEPDRRPPAGVLTLVGGALAGSGGSAARRPSARVQPHAVEFRARQAAWWQPVADPPSLTLQIGYEVVSGQLFQLPVLLPAGWEVERVELNPSGALRSWVARPAPADAVPPSVPGGAKGRALLLVDLQRPLTPGPRERGDPSGVGALFGRGRLPTLTIRLIPKDGSRTVGKETAFPDAVPLGARFREGVLAVGYDARSYQATAKASLPEAELDEDGPWGRQTPDTAYVYRGRPVEGTLLLRPRPAQVRARCRSEVYLPAGRAAVETRLLLEAEAGNPDAVDLYISTTSPPAGGEERGAPGWEWRVEQGNNAVKRFERQFAAEAAAGLAVLGGANPAGTAALLTAQPSGTRWRLTLARPLRPREPVLLHAASRLPLRGGRWDVPLPTVLGAPRMEGEVTLHLAGVDFVQVETVGLREAPAALPAPGRRQSSAWRTFRYGDGAVALTLRAPTTAADRVAEIVVDRARLTTCVRTDGAAQHHFAFRIANWTQRALPIRLPPGARLLAARSDGYLLSATPTPSPQDPLLVELPLLGRAADSGLEAAHHFEIVYEVDAPASGPWPPWLTLEAPTPVLPVAPLSFRRTWLLPPDLRPVADGRLRSLPGSDEGPGGADPPLGFLESFVKPAHAPPPHMGTQREALAAAARGLRGKRARQVVRFRELIEEAASSYLKERLVLDAVGLREAGVDAKTLLAIEPPEGPRDQTPPWETLGVRAIEAGAAPLLTTAAQARLWDQAAGVPDSVAEAVAAALEHGHDASGRFRAAADWLHQANASDGDTAATPVPALAPWTAWEPRAGVADDSQLIVVRRDRTLAAGLLLTLALTLGLRASRRRVRFLLPWLAVAGLGVLWLPAALRPLAWLPLLVGGGVALVGYVRSATRSAQAVRSAKGRLGVGSSAHPTTGNGASSAGLVGLLLLILLVAGGQAEEPEGPPTPATVYLVADPSGAPDKQSVLAPPELLDRLDALARPVAPGVNPVLLSAFYDGKAAGALAEFDAVFQAWCPGDGPALLALPLDGVRLEGDVWLDGARVLPVALAAQPGFAVPLRGAGRHKIELHFRVPIADEAGEQSLRFGAPRVSESRLRFKAPARATRLQAVVKHGAQRVLTEGDARVLEAELGRVVAPLHVRWSQDSRPGKVRVREAYVWALRADAATLTALLHYRIVEGSVATLAIDLPPELEVQAVEARRAAPEAGEPVRLRDWRVTGAAPQRVLEIDFAAPTAGELQVGLTLTPTGPLPADATLPLPAPRGESTPERSHLAYRVQGVEAVRTSPLRLTGGPAAAFAPFWPAATRPDTRSLEPAAGGYAATFVREGGQGPVLRLHLKPAPTRLRVEEQEVVVRVGPRQADVQATLKLAAPDGDLVVISLKLTPAALTITAVRGAAVRSWSQRGDQLTVWLERAAVGARLEVNGWLPLEGGRFDLPAVRVHGTEPRSTTVRLVPQTGLALTTDGLRELRPAAAPEGEWAWVSDKPDYGGSVLARTGTTDAAVRALTVAEVRDRQLMVRATVDYALKSGDVRALAVRLGNWEGKEVKLEAEGMLRQRERPARDGERSWAVELRPGTTGRVRLTLSGSMPLEEAAAGVPMPTVSVPGAAKLEAWVAVVGADLTAEAIGLTPVADAGAALADWPAEVDRLRRLTGQAWHVTGADWRLRLLPRSRASESAPVHVLLAEHSAAVADGRRWLHEALYWVQQEANTELNVILPAPATVVAVAVDGAEVAPLQPGRRRLWLPLPGRAGVRAVRLRWRYDPPAERIDRPLLETPALEGAEGGPTVWTVHVPAGFDLVPTDAVAPVPGPARAAAADLLRAAAHLHISAALAETTRDLSAAALAAAQQRFYACCRQAGQALALADPDAETGPEGQSLADWQRALLDENRLLARQHQFEETRLEAERLAAAGGAGTARTAPDEGEPTSGLAGLGTGRSVGPLPDLGTPAYASAREVGTPPELLLRPTEERRTRALLAESAGWLGLLALVGVLACWPGLLGRLAWLWPEPLLLLGALSWHYTGWTTVAALLLLLGAGGRLRGLVRGGRQLLRRRPVPPSSPSLKAAGSGS